MEIQYQSLTQLHLLFHIRETVRLQGKNWNKTLWLIHFKWIRLSKCLLETENLHSTKEKLDKMNLRVNKRSVEVFKDVKRCIYVIIWSSNKRIKWTVHHGRIKGAKVIICPSFTWTHNVSDGADMKAINREISLDGNNEESEKSLDVYLKLQVLCRHGKDWGACWDTRERATGSSNVNMRVRQRFVRVHSMLWDKHADG